MTSIADSDLSTGRDLPLREAPASDDVAASRLRQNFNLRAYLAGGAATTALIAGAIFVFASLTAYVAFNGFPIGGGDENASQLTVAADGSAAPEAAAAALGSAPGAVAATAAASTATAPAPGGSAQAGAGDGNGGAGSNPAAPGGSPVEPAPPTGTAPTPAGEAPAAGGPVSDAVDNLSNATNLPLSQAAGGPADQVDDVIGGVGGALGNPNAGQQIGDAVDGTVGGAVQGAGDLLAP